MKGASSIVKKATEIAEPVAKELGYTLWDVEYVKEGADWYLRYTIDSDSGIGIEDCEKMSRAIDPVLDEYDFIEDMYMGLTLVEKIISEHAGKNVHAGELVISKL